MTELLSVQYDRGSDVLYITTPDYTSAHGREGAPGVMWRYSDEGERLVGVTIIDFKSYWHSRIGVLAGDLASHFQVPKKAARSILENAE